MKIRSQKLFLTILALFSLAEARPQCTNSETFTYTGGMQTYIVPVGVTSLTIECYGAKGGNGNQPSSIGGNGAYMKGDFAVTPGETLNIIAGGMGVSGVNSLEGGGGGGGSFVIRSSGNVPLIIAGGGGGGSYLASTPGTGASETTTGFGGGYAPTLPGQGGYTDNGGGGGTGAGGGGWDANGSSNTWANGGLMQGGAGGVPNFGYLGAGGYGGGGSAYHGGGGGGGYSGGGGGLYTVGGGGAGSYNVGTNQTNTGNVNAGNGYVVITYEAAYYVSVSDNICFGDDYTFPDGSTQTNITSQVVHTSNLIAVVGGCDSIVETTLDVYPEIDNGIAVVGLTMTADALTGTYQWITSSDGCLTYSELMGETNQSFTATVDGNYAVVITENGCADTSDCINITYFSIEEEDRSSFKLFPNPTKQIVTIDLLSATTNGRVEIISITGSLIWSEDIVSTKTMIGLDQFGSGVYFVRIISVDGTVSEVQKLIVQ